MSSVDSYSIPKELKLTTKYTEEDREKARQMFKNGESIHSISKEIPMSRRMVQFTLFPERKDLAKKNFAERQKDGRYKYPTKIQSAKVAMVRNRKREMIDKLIKKHGTRTTGN